MHYVNNRQHSHHVVHRDVNGFRTNAAELQHCHARRLRLDTEGVAHEELNLSVAVRNDSVLV